MRRNFLLIREASIVVPPRLISTACISTSLHDHRGNNGRFRDRPSESHRRRHGRPRRREQRREGAPGGRERRRGHVRDRRAPRGAGGLRRGVPHVLDAAPLRQRRRRPPSRWCPARRRCWGRGGRREARRPARGARGRRRLHPRVQHPARRVPDLGEAHVDEAPAAALRRAAVQRRRGKRRIGGRGGEEELRDGQGDGGAGGGHRSQGHGRDRGEGQGEGETGSRGGRR